MNKNEFLNRLKEDLSSLSDEERQNALKYYEEYFTEAAENQTGESVEDMACRIEKEFAVLALSEPSFKGPEQPITVEIKKEEKKNRYKPKNPERSLGILIVLLCTFPFWLPLLIALVSVAFGVFMTIFGVAFAVAAMALAGFVMVGAGFMTVGYGVINLFIDAAGALYPIGAGFAAIGIGVIFAAVFTKLTAVIFKSQFKFAGWTIRGITNKFSRQGA